MACSGSSAVNLLYGNGDGTLQAAVNRVVGVPVVALAAADVNMDQVTDLVAGTSGGGMLAALWMPAAHGQPRVGRRHGQFRNFNGVGAVDLNGDGRTDVASAVPDGYYLSAPSTVGRHFSGVDAAVAERAGRPGDRRLQR